MRFNPFRPNSIVTPEMFQGRKEELAFIQQSLFQTKFGNPQHFLIEGERGLGKSSLFLMVNQYAIGNRLLSDGTRLNFMVLSLELDSTQSFTDILRSLAAELEKSISEKERIKSVAKDIWNFLKDWEILGVKYNSHGDSITRPFEILDKLVRYIGELLEKIEDTVDGILILLDEADRPGITASLGELVKLLTEKLTKRGCDRILIGMTGQPGLIEKLKQSHESSSRIFTTLLLKPLSKSEITEVITNGLNLANKVNSQNTRIEDRALSAIQELSEGYPHFLQEFAYKSFDVDTDWNIDEDDVKSGTNGTIGALNQLGVKYFNDMYFKQIGSEEYRLVLQSMARYSDEWVSREKIRKDYSFKETTLNNALQALKTRGIIISNPSVKGEFKLPTKSFAAWIKAFSVFEIRWADPVEIQDSEISN